MAFADDDEHGNQGDDTPKKDSAQTQIVKLAREKARELGHAQVTFNHLLFALIKKDQPEIDSLLNPKLRSNTVLNMVEKDLKLRPKTLAAADSPIELSVEASRALKRAEVVSGKNWSSDKIFAPELLHAMLERGRIGEVPPQKTGQKLEEWEKIRDAAMNETSPTLDYVRGILSNHTYEVEDAKKECRKLIDEFAAARGEKKSQQKQITAGKSGQTNGEPEMPNKSAYIIPLNKDSLLAEFATNMNEKMEHSNHAPVVGREDEIDEVIRVLARSAKNNPVLIGEAGVGKTAVVEGLVQRINAGNVPEFMKTKNILQLDLSLIVAGTKYRGQFEERLKTIMKELLELKDAIVFIDELHTLMGAGSAEGSLDAANILKPALARGEITLIGATTPKEFKKSFEKDKAMERRVQAVKVPEPGVPKAKLMVKAHKERLENFHGVTMGDDIFDACTEMSARYFNNDSNAQPDKGVTLADDVAVLVKLDEKRPDKVVTLADVEAIVAKKTGRPVGTISQNNLATLKNLPAKLGENLYNQPAAIKSVTRALQRSHTGMANPKRPIGSFAFLGPTGVGKTELARLLADTMFEGEKSIIRFDMSEYAEKHSVAKLIGAPPGYVGYEEGGLLTDKVKRAPYSVVLFDEIEKAHPDVADIFLQILEDGRLTDSMGTTVDFTNTIIIMTSNAITSSNVMKNKGFGEPTAEESQKANANAIIELLKKKGFKAEFINRLDDVVTFNDLPKEIMPKVIQNEIRKMKEGREGLKVLTLDPAPDVVPWLVDAGWEQDGKFGARPYKRLVDKTLADEFSDAVVDGRLRQGVPTTAKITVKPDKSGLSFEYNEAAAGVPVAASASFDAENDGLLNREPVNDPGLAAEGPAKPAVGG